MKNRFLTFSAVALFVIGVWAPQAFSFSAFSKGGKLFVTVLVDKCNSHGGTLSVWDSCYPKEESVEDSIFSAGCVVGLTVCSTMMYCPDRGTRSETFEFDLRAKGVSEDNETLYVQYKNQSRLVQIDWEESVLPKTVLTSEEDWICHSPEF